MLSKVGWSIFAPEAAEQILYRSRLWLRFTVTLRESAHNFSVSEPIVAVIFACPKLKGGFVALAGNENVVSRAIFSVYPCARY